MITRYSLVIATLLLCSLSCKSKNGENKNNVQQTSDRKNISKTNVLFSDTMIGNKKFIFKKAFYDNGTLKQTGFYSPDSLMQGIWTNYYPDGKLESITTYHNGMRDGRFKSYHENGQLWTELIYSNNKTMEVVCNFDRDGEPKPKGTLKNGNGSIILYDDNGERRSIEQYKDGKLAD